MKKAGLRPSSVDSFQIKLINYSIDNTLDTYGISENAFFRGKTSVARTYSRASLFYLLYVYGDLSYSQLGNMMGLDRTTAYRGKSYVEDAKRSNSQAYRYFLEKHNALESKIEEFIETNK